MKPVSLSRRQAIIGTLFAAASGVAYARAPVSTVPRVPEGQFNAWIPSNVGGWGVQPSSSVVLPPSDQLSDRLYDDLATRVYVADKLPPVMLLIAYNNVQNGVVQVHLPEKCYSASGFSVSDTAPIQVHTIAGSTVPANHFAASSNERIEHVLYWTRVGTSFPRSWAQRHLAVMESDLKGHVPDGVIMRASVIGEENAATALPVLQRFISDFLSIAPQPLRTILLGRSI